MIPQLPIAVTRPAGNPLAIVWFLLEITDDGGRIWKVEPTDDAIEEQVRKHFPDFESWVRIANDPREFGSDMHRFRRVWRLEAGGRIAVALEDAKGLHRAQVEERAQAAVTDLASAFVDAILASDDAAVTRLRARRERLLAASADERIDKAGSLAELAAVDPLVDI